MKKLLFVLLVSIAALTAVAQYERFGVTNAVRMTAIEVYEPDADGFYKPGFAGGVTVVDSVERIYAYDKKTKTAYVQTPHGNYAVVVKDELAKELKNDKSVNKLKGKDLEAAIEICDLTLKTRADQYNAQHEKYLQVLREQERKKRMEDSIRQQRRRDSLLRVQEAERILQKKQALEQYRAEHVWNILPLDGQPLKCQRPDCDNRFTGDEVYCAGIVGDTIYYAIHEEIALDVTALKFHYAKYRPDEKRDPKMWYHTQAFADSLYSRTWLTPGFVDLVNAESFNKAINEITKKAPYGFFDVWGWDDDYGTLTFHCDYLNTNKKTIKYIDVYWTLKNDVNDSRGSGHFKGTGPVEYLHSGSWSWDNTLYFVPGDATTLVITKVILTYMNGTTKVLNRKDLVFN